MNCRSRRGLRGAALLSSVVALGGACSDPAAAAARAPDRGAFHALLLSGGGTREENYASHLEHLRAFHGLLVESGVPPGRIAVLAADGADPAPDLARRGEDPEAFWRIDGTHLERRLRAPLTFANSALPGVALRPATRAELGRWASAARQMKPGDTLLVYVTDHGTQDARDPLENRITLWGGREAISVRQWRALLDRIAPGVRTVAVMSQCFSGAFARWALADPGKGACGFFSSTANRPAYGCYPEALTREGLGHGFAFAAALSRAVRLDGAHREVLLGDATPDVPLRTSDVLLEDVLSRAARGRGKARDALVDRLLAGVTRDADRGEWDLASGIARRYGLGDPRTLAAVAAAQGATEPLHATLDRHARVWDGALADANQGTLDRFLTARAGWRTRLGRPASGARDRAAADLVAELDRFASADPEREARTTRLAESRAQASEAAYRMEVRLAALLRVRVLLQRIAGRLLVREPAHAADAAALDRLLACEATALPARPRPRADPVPLEPFPSLEEERRLAESLAPSWIGLEFRALPSRLAARLEVGSGAVRVVRTLPGSPARAAGLVPGDLVVGLAGQSLDQPGDLRVSVLLAPAGRPLPLAVWRAGRRIEIGVVSAPSR